MRSCRQQNGFTLVELIIVIVILGIISAFAIPKFINLSNDARRAVIEGFSGSIQSEINLIYSKAVLQGIEKSPSGTVTLGRTPIQTVYGYPAGSSRGIGFMVNHPRDINSFQAGPGNWIFASTKVNNCYIRYTEATANSPASVYTGTLCGSLR
ncbi:MAG: prepilin-type N-terminal cleavage/methylation domain-containing protein [Coxiellaceae bacterium]|nr:prepilin-type N-terminal cleavage/methylation domain-containing protein [Coxiellaceae bacterium]